MCYNKIMSVNEASRTTLFLKYAKHFLNFTFAFEAKICKERSLAFDLVVPHQVASLYQTKHSLFNYKIPDTGFQNPFDGLQLRMIPAYVLIFWYQKRDDKRCTMIDIDEWIHEKDFSTRKSLTYERACEIGKSFSL